MKHLWQAAPVRVLAAVQAVIALAVGFGLSWTDEQVALVLAAVSAVVGLIGDGTAVSRSAMTELAGK